MTAQYRISNTHGWTHAGWSHTYTSERAAIAALQRLLGWERMFFSESFTTDEGSAQCVYPTREARDVDQDGAHAPRISREWSVR